MKSVSKSNRAPAEVGRGPGQGSKPLYSRRLARTGTVSCCACLYTSCAEYLFEFELDILLVVLSERFENPTVSQEHSGETANESSQPLRTL